jgi:hypothetical protein
VLELQIWQVLWSFRTSVPTERIWESADTLKRPAKTAATQPTQIWECRGVCSVGWTLANIEGSRPSLPSPRYKRDCLWIKGGDIGKVE